MSTPPRPKPAPPRTVQQQKQKRRDLAITWSAIGIGAAIVIALVANSVMEARESRLLAEKKAATELAINNKIAEQKKREFRAAYDSAISGARAAIDAGDPGEARRKLQAAIDIGHKTEELKSMMREADEKLAALDAARAAAKRESDLKQLAEDYIWATNLKTDDCGQRKRAAEIISAAVGLDPVPRDREAALAKATAATLLCFDGSDTLWMALSVVKSKPFAAYVTIKNVGTRARHANPGYFTLVTRLSHGPRPVLPVVAAQFGE